MVTVNMSEIYISICKQIDNILLINHFNALNHASYANKLVDLHILYISKLLPSLYVKICHN